MTEQWWTQLKSVTLHDDREPLPPLWPDGASEEYVSARKALLAKEVALRDQIETVASLRRSLPAGTPVTDYELTEGPRDLVHDDPVTPVRLSDLFREHETLIIYHLMFHPEDDAACAACSMWVDGFNGVASHLTRRTGFAVIARAPIEKLRAWGRRRGWHGLRLVSSADSSFSRDLGFEAVSGGQWPTIATFRRDGDEIRHWFSQCADLPEGERGIDLLTPVWNLFDLLPQGRGDWLPDNTYPRDPRQCAMTGSAIDGD